MLRRVVVATVIALLFAGCGPSLKSMSAGQVGCVESQIEISDESSDFGSETWIATCGERRYVCSKVRVSAQSGFEATHQVSCAAEGGGADETAAPAEPTGPEPQKEATQTEPPHGAAGFELGKSVADTSTLCTEKGHAWAERGAGKFQCAGMPEEIGLEGHAMLSFCTGQLCGIELVTQPPDSGKNFAGSFMSLSEALDRKYGSPEKRETQIPSDCHDKQDLTQCLKSGRARLMRSWSWTTGERITLTLDLGSEGSELAIRIVYTRDPAGVRPKTDAL